MHWMILPLKRYADFSGRSRRMEYWMFLLLCVVVAFGLALFTGALAAGTAETDPTAAIFGSVPLIIFWLVVIIPSIAVQVRRFHDQDKSGWFVLLNFIPFVGGLIVLVFMFLEGTRGPNRFGPDPKTDEFT